MNAQEIKEMGCYWEYSYLKTIDGTEYIHGNTLEMFGVTWTVQGADDIANDEGDYGVLFAAEVDGRSLSMDFRVPKDKIIAFGKVDDLTEGGA